MNKWILCSLLIVSPFASTGTLKYKIHLDFSVHNEPMRSADLLTHLGETASLVERTSKGERTFQIVASESTFNGESLIHIKMKIESIDLGGHRTLLAEPEILTREDQLAEVSIGSLEKETDIKVQVQVHRTLD